MKKIDEFSSETSLAPKKKNSEKYGEVGRLRCDEFLTVVRNVQRVHVFNDALMLAHKIN